MKEAEIPDGDTQIRVWSFVGDVRLYVPQDVGVSVFSSAFVAGVRLFGAKRDRILSPLEMTSDNYETAQRRIRLETTSFVGDVRVDRA
jgi:lia operon protein LiaF